MKTDSGEKFRQPTHSSGSFGQSRYFTDAQAVRQRRFFVGLRPDLPVHAF